MNKLFEAFGNIFRVPDLRKRVMFTLGLLAVYRLGGHIPTPGINIKRWEEFMSSNAGSIFGFFDLFAGWFGTGRVHAAWIGMRPGSDIEEQATCAVRYDGGGWADFHHGFHQDSRRDRQTLRLVFGSCRVAVPL